MTPVVVEVGPHTVRGPSQAPVQWISAAMECIDDRVAVLDGQLVEVGQLWRDVLDAVTAEHCDVLALVFPSWWSAARIGVVSDAADEIASDVVVLSRSSILGSDSEACLIELSEEYLVVTPPDCEPIVLAREEADVAAHLDLDTPVMVDAPAGVARLPAEDIAALRVCGHTIRYTDRRRLVCAASAVIRQRGQGDCNDTVRPRRGLAAVAAGVAVTVAAVSGGWAAQALSGESPSVPSGRLLVEGQVAVEVPAHWSVERLTQGPGSPRLRVSAPGGSPALHVTQSTGTAATTIAEVAESLRGAFDAEPDGVFTDFDPTGEVGGRAAVTYRELRAHGETTWAVVLDGATRIAIGCQGAPTRDDICVQAVRSARVVQ